MITQDVLMKDLGTNMKYFVIEKNHILRNIWLSLILKFPPTNYIHKLEQKTVSLNLYCYNISDALFTPFTTMSIKGEFYETLNS